jgi:probable HAF family extracellular repeat protein
MIQTEVTRTFTRAGLALAGKLGYVTRELVPVAAAAVVLAASASQLAYGQEVPPGPCRGAKCQMGPDRPLHAPMADTPASAQYKFITIGVPGSANAQAWGINNARLVTGYYVDANSVSHGFVWQAGAFQTIDYPGAVYTALFAVNNLGVAGGYYGDGTAEHAVTYSVPNGTWGALPDIAGYPNNECCGINDAGVAVGNAYSADFSTAVAYIWHPGKAAYSFFAEPDAQPYSTYPNAINNKGQVVGFYVDASGVSHGFLKQGKTYTTIDAPEATNTYPYAINNSGTIGGDQVDVVNAQQGYVETSGGLFTTVDYPGPSITAVEGINDHGDISGTYVDNPSGARRAYIGLRP